ncbi:MAG TPA: biotin transporter BioY [Methanospirillum sp.]|nr:biotin transporter BioY [Methanospirillum sp.]
MFGDLKRAEIITQSALFIAMTAVFSWISIPFVPVPMTLQTLAILLTGVVMKRYAAIPLTLYLLLGAIGLPVFSKMTAGLGVLLGPTGGYLIGFIPAAVMVGLAFESRRSLIRIAGIGIATLIIYAFGLTWLILSTGMDPSKAVMVGMLIFLPGDIVKAAAVYLISSRLETLPRWQSH